MEIRTVCTLGGLKVERLRGAHIMGSPQQVQCPNGQEQCLIELSICLVLNKSFGCRGLERGIFASFVPLSRSL